MVEVLKDPELADRIGKALVESMDRSPYGSVDEIHRGHLSFCLSKSFFSLTGEKRVVEIGDAYTVLIGKLQHMIWEVLKPNELAITWNKITLRPDMLPDGVPIELKFTRKSLPKTDNISEERFDIPTQYFRELEFAVAVTWHENLNPSMSGVLHVCNLMRPFPPWLRRFKFTKEELLASLAWYASRLERLLTAIEKKDVSMLTGAPWSPTYSWECGKRAKSGYHCPYVNICGNKQLR